MTLSLVPYLGASSYRLPPPGPSPPDNSNISLSFITGVLYDLPPLLKSFGDVVHDVPKEVRRGTPVSAVFIGANPRNNLRLEKTYAVVEKLVAGSSAPSSAPSHLDESQDLRIKDRARSQPPVEGSSGKQEEWQPVRNDADWHLVFRWRRVNEVLATSEVTITWETEDWAEPGTYRLRYFGDSKSLLGSITGFEGISSSFELVV